MRSREAQAENETLLVRELTRAIETISNSTLTALNEIDPNQESSGTITINNTSDSEDDTENYDGVNAVQRSRKEISRVIRSLYKLTPNLSDKKITITFCMKQFRTMLPPNENTN
jgi:hypothetical protein